jgi:hypothetical protein
VLTAKKHFGGARLGGRLLIEKVELIWRRVTLAQVVCVSLLEGKSWPPKRNLLKIEPADDDYDDDYDATHS